MADTKYVDSEGALLRWLDHAMPFREVYRKGGKWVPYGGEYSDWLYGKPLSDSEARERMKQIDED